MFNFLNRIKDKWTQFCYNPESIKTITYVFCFVWVIFLIWITQES